MDKVGVSQKAIIFNEQGKFLVLLRGATAPSEALKWDLPGGDVDFGEKPREAMLREIKEETGLEVSNLKPFDVHAWVNDKGYHWFTIGYTAEVKSAQVKISWEHDEYKWVTKAEFAKLPSIPKIVEFVKKVEAQ